jgi:hypothetical protein
MNLLQSTIPSMVPSCKGSYAHVGRGVWGEGGSPPQKEEGPLPPSSVLAQTKTQNHTTITIIILLFLVHVPGSW